MTTRKAASWIATDADSQDAQDGRDEQDGIRVYLRCHDICSTVKGAEYLLLLLYFSRPVYPS